MEKYIEGNKAAWEEAFDKRDASWGAEMIPAQVNSNFGENRYDSGYYSKQIE